jgi:sugar lactone lactonase YvrE
MALDADNVYFTNTNANTLMKVAKAGGPAEVIAPASTPGMGQPWGVAVAGPYVYWATFADETIQRVGLAGESPTVLVTGQGYAMEIVVDATSLYWTRQGGMVGKATRDGGPPMVWTSLGAWSIAIDETSIYWTNYNALGTGPGVGKMSLDGESPVLLATAERDDPRGIAVDTSSVYWTNHFAGTVMKVSKAGGPTTMLASDQGYPDFVAVDSTGVYWTAQRDGTVMRVGLDGGPPMIIASGQLSPGRIALDACYVYWLGGGAGTGVVTKVAK